MSRNGGPLAPRSCVLALAWFVAGLGWTADTGRPAPPALQADDELGEVLVEGTRTKPGRPTFDDYQAPFNFMARLVGEFVIDGTVDLRAQGRSEDLRKVSGRIECVGFGVAPGVLCELEVRWPEVTRPDGGEIPGGASTLNPAVVMYGYETTSPSMVGITGARDIFGRPPAEQPGVSFVVVDNRGVAETATGYMISFDTMRSRSKCLAVPGNCEREVRITAQPNLKTVEMHIDLVIDERKAVSQVFVMHRVPGTQSVVYGRKPEKGQKGRKKK